ncbi:MAG TPA: hypothetical protein VHI13_07255 [Candidatus Kapabacteria bacterium]|nr:hypothetical protein [Candidatus Kapabacteria bacterium]
MPGSFTGMALGGFGPAICNHLPRALVPFFAMRAMLRRRASLPIRPAAAGAIAAAITGTAVGAPCGITALIAVGGMPAVIRAPFLTGTAAAEGRRLLRLRSIRCGLLRAVRPIVFASALAAISAAAPSAPPAATLAVLFVVLLVLIVLRIAVMACAIFAIVILIPIAVIVVIGSGVRTFAMGRFVAASALFSVPLPVWPVAAPAVVVPAFACRLLSGVLIFLGVVVAIVTLPFLVRAVRRTLGIAPAIAPAASTASALPLAPLGFLRSLLAGRLNGVLTIDRFGAGPVKLLLFLMPAALASAHVASARLPAGLRGVGTARAPGILRISGTASIASALIAAALVAAAFVALAHIASGFGFATTARGPVARLRVLGLMSAVCTLIGPFACAFCIMRLAAAAVMAVGIFLSGVAAGLPVARGRCLCALSRGGLLVGSLLIVIVILVALVKQILELIERRSDIGEMEKRILRLSDIDEGGVHSLDDAFDASKVDGAYMALLVWNFEENFCETIVLGNGNADLTRGRVNNYLFLHGRVRKAVGNQQDGVGAREEGTRRGERWEWVAGDRRIEGEGTAYRRDIPRGRRIARDSVIGNAKQQPFSWQR